MSSALPRLLAALFAGLLMAAAPARAGTEVDLALVIAVDISNSMDPEEQDLQRNGFVDAFRSPEVHDAIRGGAVGRVGVVYAEWAGTFLQHVVVPWTLLEGAEDSMAFADRLSRAPISRGPRTSISGAIDLSMRLLNETALEPLRKVVDISGDGANNQGRSVTLARDEAVSKGITINGLPIMMNRAYGSWDTANLDVYYRDCVIGGPGSFLIPIRERGQFSAAIRTKIIREIADLGSLPGAALVVPVQNAPRTNCLSADTRDWDMMRN